MSYSDEQINHVTNESFWLPGIYKRTTKRIDDGYKSCKDLQQLLHERADIENDYAKNLKSWSQKWDGLIENGPEYGTNKLAWMSLVTEAKRLADAHVKIKNEICFDIIKQIKEWEKNHFHKSILQTKERIENEANFKKAQKPWVKLLRNVEKSKVDYFTASNNEKIAIKQENDAASNDNQNFTNEQLRKFQERVAQRKDEVLKNLGKYDKAVEDINSYHQTYMQDMSNVFAKCQDIEQGRLQFIKSVFFAVHQALDVSKERNIHLIYGELFHTINNADHKQDLEWWANNYGINMILLLPVRMTNSDLCVATSESSKNFRTTIQNGPPTYGSKPVHLKENDWDDDGYLIDDGKSGTEVRALYDYIGSENDELTFEKGDIFENLDKEDEQGWCKGRKNGKVGLYPANYVQPL